METVDQRCEIETNAEEAAMILASFMLRTGARLMYPVPYAGDEQVTTYVRKPISEFMLTKPA